MAPNRTAGQAVSDIAQAEGGTTKGSLSAQMQSRITEDRNADRIENRVTDELETGAPIT